MLLGHVVAEIDGLGLLQNLRGAFLELALGLDLLLGLGQTIHEIRDGGLFAHDDSLASIARSSSALCVSRSDSLIAWSVSASGSTGNGHCTSTAWRRCS